MLMLPPVEEVDGLNEFPVLYWNHVALEMNRITHSLGGPHTGPTMSSRALGLLHLAMHDAYFIALGAPIRPAPGTVSEPSGDAGTVQSYLTDDDLKSKSFEECRPEPGWGQEKANDALTGAAIAVLDSLYKRGGPGISALANNTLTSALASYIDGYKPHIDTLSAPYRFGECVAGVILALLAVKEGEPGADQGRYEPKQEPGFFRDEPVNPVRRVPIDPNNPERGEKSVRIYHAPFYGTTVKTVAVQVEPTLEKHPELGTEAYKISLREVMAVGGASTLNKTVRTPDQTVAGIYWAYDGANLIGTPPRLYNQIIRVVAWDRKTGSIEDNTADFVRLFALVNVAMTDAGKFAWREKYKYEFWRPLTGVREHDGKSGPAPMGPGSETLEPEADPFWLTLGAPDTNTNKVSFKPPFPAYPSGHATFGASCFQMTRLFYKHRDKLDFKPDAADSIAFSFVSEELNGISRDLLAPFDPAVPLVDQPGIVRTRVVRGFKSLWQAIFENAVSRVFLGVHWHFDAFEPKDTATLEHGEIKPRPDGSIEYKDSDDIKYGRQIGGVPLGLAIANDIWGSGMAPASETKAALASDTTVGRELKSSNTSVR